MADSILRLRVQSEEYDNKLKRASEAIQRYAEKCREAGGTLEHLDEGVLEFTRALGGMETVSKSAKGSIGELTKAFTDLSVQYNKLTDEEKNAPFGKALKSSLDELKGRIQSGNAEIKSIKDSLNGSGGLSGALDAIAGKFGVSTEMLTKFGGGLAVATTALKVAKDAFMQSESNIDEWGRTLKGAEGAYDMFLQTLNNGNWSNFFSNLSQAITGARDLYDAFDRLNSIKANNAVAIATTQAEIQQLRLLKQQGQDVDDKIKEATARLKTLQSQSTNAGINAGKSQVVNTLRNGVNSIGGAPINNATLNRVADNIAKQGQAYFDYMKRRAADLEKKGMVTKTETINDSQGGTYQRQYKVFDISALSKEQQKQYAIAKVVTERETALQKGLTVWSQAVNEQASNAREQFRDNRYALQGSGGGGGGKGRTSTVDKEAEQTARMLAELRKQEAKATKDIADARAREHQTETKGLSGFNEQTISAWTAMMKKDLESADFGSVVYNSIEENMRDMTTITDLTKEALKRGLDPQSLGLTELFETAFDKIDVPDSTLKAIVEKINAAIKDGVKLEINAESGKVTGKKQEKKNDTQDDTKKIVGGLSQVAGGLQQMGVELPDGVQKVMGVVQGVMSVIEGVQAIISLTQTPAIIANTVAMGALTSAMTANTVSNFIPFFAHGGMVPTFANGGLIGKAAGGMLIPGNSFSGDNLRMPVDGGRGFIGVNSGELILNRSQQANLASQLQGSSGHTVHVVGKLSGESLFLCAENWAKRTGKGEFVTWR